MLSVLAIINMAILSISVISLRCTDVPNACLVYMPGKLLGPGICEWLIEKITPSRFPK